MILLFFYNQTDYEFKINQIGWNERGTVSSLLSEKHPLILKGVPSVAFWTQQDCMMRQCYEQAPVFKDRGLSAWLMAAAKDAPCPWSLDHARLLGTLSGLNIWADQWIGPLVQTNPFWALWYRPSASCWAGSRFLWKTKALTALFVTEGAIQISIMPGSCKKALMNIEQGIHIGDITVHDTPFVKDLKFMDIVLRPGHLLWMPAHWYMSWKNLETSESCPMVCCVEYHTPVSLYR